MKQPSMNMKMVKDPIGERGPLTLTCKSEDVQKEVDLLQTAIREPVMSVRLRGVQRAAAVQELARRAPVLYAECRPLFEKALRPMSESDRRILGFMLEQMRAVEGTPAQGGTVEAVSEKVGQYLFDRFVAPDLQDSPATSTAPAAKRPRIEEV